MAYIIWKNSSFKSTKDATIQYIIWVNFFIHYEVLPSKAMSPEMELGMKGTVKIVNFIQSSALNKFFENLYVHHTHHLFFILLSDGCQKVRWSTPCKLKKNKTKKTTFFSWRSCCHLQMCFLRRNCS